MSPSFWDETVSWAAFLIDRIASKIVAAFLTQIAHERLFGCKVFALEGNVESLKLRIELS